MSNIKVERNPDGSLKYPYPRERLWSDCEDDIKYLQERLTWHDRLIIEKNKELDELCEELCDCRIKVSESIELLNEWYQTALRIRNKSFLEIAAKTEKVLKNEISRQS